MLKIILLLSVPLFAAEPLYKFPYRELNPSQLQEELKAEGFLSWNISCYKKRKGTWCEIYWTEIPKDWKRVREIVDAHVPKDPNFEWNEAYRRLKSPDYTLADVRKALLILMAPAKR